MERIEIGGTILYREKCPDCGEFNMSGSQLFNCSCGMSMEMMKLIIQECLHLN